MFGRKRTDEELIYADPLAGEKPSAAKSRAFRALAAVLIATGLVILAVVALSFTIQGQGQRYQNALTLLEQKEYEAAAAELESLGDFRDSADLLARLRSNEEIYTAALNLVEQQRYEEAIAVFQTLGDYRDALEQIDVCSAAVAVCEENTEAGGN